jgi:serine/threonine protein phosphatase PrpC
MALTRRSDRSDRQQAVRLECGQESNQGRRSQNEDSVAWNEFDNGVLAIIADGMGGGVDGRLFSSTAVARIQSAIISLREGVSATALRQALQAALDELHRLRASDERYQESGTTLVVAGVMLAKSGASVHVVHVGDSRAYTIRANGTITSLTRDHSYAEALIRDGMLPEEAQKHPQALRLTHALGDQLVIADIPEYEQTAQLAVGDSLLLCTDGVSKYLSADELVAALSGRAAQQAATQIVQQALHNGSNDNVSALVVHCKAAERKGLPFTSMLAALVVAAVVALGGFVITQLQGFWQPPIPTQGPTITPLAEETSPVGLPTSTAVTGGNTSTPAPSVSPSNTPTPTPTPTFTPTSTNTPRPPPSRTPTIVVPATATILAPQTETSLPAVVPSETTGGSVPPPGETATNGPPQPAAETPTLSPSEAPTIQPEVPTETPAITPTSG